MRGAQKAQPFGHPLDGRVRRQSAQLAPHLEQNFGGENGFWLKLVFPHELQNLMFLRLRSVRTVTPRTRKTKTSVGRAICDIAPNSRSARAILTVGQSLRFSEALLLRKKNAVAANVSAVQTWMTGGSA